MVHCVQSLQPSHIRAVYFYTILINFGSQWNCISNSQLQINNWKTFQIHLSINHNDKQNVGNPISFLFVVSIKDCQLNSSSYCAAFTTFEMSWMWKSWVAVPLLIAVCIQFTNSTNFSAILTPSDSNSSICESFTEYSFCGNLSHLLTSSLLSNSSKQSSALELLLLNGTHKIVSAKVHLVLQDKRSVAIQSYHDGKRAEIVCEGNNAFSFSNINNLHLIGLTFSRCGDAIHFMKHENYFHRINAALFLNTIESLFITKVIVTESKGYGLLAFNLFGKNEINNCTFQYNNIYANPSVCSIELERCEGGNIAFYFLDALSLTKPATIYLLNSEIKGGSEVSELSSSCEDLSKQSPSVFRASGLVVVFAQKNYQVSLHVNNTLFQNNTKNTKHRYPAILIHTYSYRINNVEFNSSSFIREGTMLISIVPNLKSITYRISNCRFKNSHAPAIHLCSKSVLQKHDISKHWDMDITIYNSVFISCSTAIKAENTQITVRNCIFSHSKKTAVYAENSIITLMSKTGFFFNKGHYGGALNLNRSQLLIMSNSCTVISRNTADYGGGIYAVSLESDIPSGADIGLYSLCTITKYTDTGSASVTLEKNRAHFGGYSIFGGNYINCKYNCTKLGECQFVRDMVSFDYQLLPPFISIIPYMNITRNTEVSSPANRICLCENNKPTKNCKSVNVTAFRGQEISVALITAGKLGGSTPAMLIARTSQINSDVGYRQHLQVLSTSCTEVKYTVHSNQSKVTIKLKISEETPMREKSNHFNIEVQLSECPAGYRYAISLGTLLDCKCRPIFQKFAMKCNDKNGTIEVSPKQWVGYYTNKELIVTNNYPLDYLWIHSNNRNISLNEPDEQCNYNRTGVLCGACKANFSVVLGSSNCRKCSNVYLLLIIPFALAGVALVVLLLKCNLTVSVGHINGIIFYANIIQVNKTLLFPAQNTAYQIFSTFIAWLNLDLGFETCFFENTNTYTKVWLQFVFPVYLWILIGLIIILVKHSKKIGSLVGSNSVPVLATLFLLSYAKLLRTVIAVVFFTYIEFVDHYIAVWREDGNLEYLKSPHYVLFFVALLVTSFYLLPLTLLILLAPCLQAKSHNKAFKWVNRLKPFLDAYQGPYTDKFRFWTGLLLIVRLGLFTVYAANFENDCSISFFWTIAATALLTAVSLRNEVYRHKLANWIELLSLINIVMVCSINWLTTNTGYKKWYPIGEYATCTSVSVMMLIFLGVIVYQVIPKLCPNIFTQKETPVIDQTAAHHDLKKDIPTSSVVELEECDQLKEPLLDSDES